MLGSEFDSAQGLNVLNGSIELIENADSMSSWDAQISPMPLPKQVSMVLQGTQCEAFISTKRKRSEMHPWIDEIQAKFQCVLQNGRGTLLESTVHAAVDLPGEPQQSKEKP